MESIVPFDREATDQAEFERRLLAAARRDPDPPDLAGAWARFAGALGPIVSDPALGGGRSGTAGGAVPPAAGAQVVRAAAAKWVLLGVLAGSATTAAILGRTAPGRTLPQRAVVPERSAPPPQVAEERGASAAPSPVGESVTSHERSATPHGARPKRAGDLRSRELPARVGNIGSSDQADDAAKGRPSPLAVEVARLDAARTSNAVGDYDRTLQLIERYHREFPDGALAPDADVVALEAVAAKRDRAETARRAALFLARYPDDPHAAHVKWLAAQ
jgi:hypothetical protein